MTELERKALLGDKQAQQECTEKGIVLPCPFCGGEVKLDELDFYMFCCDKCGAGITFAKEFEDGTADDCTKDESIEKWNTRPAPPIGRCAECKEYDTENCSDGCGWCQVWDIGRFDDGFCDKFKSKERE